VTAPSGQRLNAAELAQSVMDYVVQSYTLAAGVEPLPARQVIAGGETRLVAWDCEQVVLTLTGIDIDVPQDQPITPGRLKATSVRHVAFNIQIVRCYPTQDSNNRMPSAAKITAAGTTMLKDAGQLSQALFEWVTRAVSSDSPMGVVSAGVGAILPVGPQGGFAGVEGAVVVTADLV
jgi:hypothetical protein